jgi:hypothetical protein
VMANQGQADHGPVQPSWDCESCGQPWPCAVAKVQLLDHYRAFPSILRIYLSEELHSAIVDMAAALNEVPTDLRARFMDWARG